MKKKELMTKVKTFFIIPGFKMQVEGKYFNWLVNLLKSNNFKVVKVPVTWNHRTLSQNAREFTDFYYKHKTKTNYVLGFSYGAVIALLTTNTLKPRKISCAL